MKEWHNMSVSDVSLELGTDTKAGKTNIDPNRKRKHANNVIHIPSLDSSAIAKNIASDVSLLLLSVTYLIAVFAGHSYESITGICIAGVVFALGCYIKYRSAKRINNAYRLLLPSAKVTENGKNLRLSVFDVEVGDLINFSRGDIIPADARLVSSLSLRVAERRIDDTTGKIGYVSFDKDADAPTDETKLSYPNCVYAGSMVVSGSGSAIVTAIGEDTVSSRSGAHIEIVSDDDIPDYLRKFNKEAKIVSLVVLASVIPLSLFGLYRQTLISDSARADLLYSFILALSLAVTCMSDLVTLPAEALVTKEILPSSRLKYSSKTPDSRITKFSSAEKLASIDTVLILSPEVLTDKKTLVRNVFFAGEDYRFDSLNSKFLTDFVSEIAPYYHFTSDDKYSGIESAVLEFIKEFDLRAPSMSIGKVNPSFLRDSSTGTRICAFEKDNHNRPDKFIARTSASELIYECSHFRNEGGSIWKTDRVIFDKITEWYESNRDAGHQIYIYFSSEGQNAPSVFEGMIAVGDEYPYNDGCSALFDESAVAPVLVLENETSKNLDIAQRSGIAQNTSDIVIASEYAKSGLDISDAPISAKVYVGFGKTGTVRLIERLRKYGRTVLPIIKDSSNRHAISPENIYAVHEDESYDSIKLAASVSLKPADAVTRRGGLIDAFNIIKRSSMAHLKLGIYRNYLLLSLFIRAFSVCLPLTVGNSALTMTSVMILFAGFVTDYAALFAIMCASGLPVRPSDTSAEAKRLFSHSLIYLYIAAALISTGASVFVTNQLLNASRISVSAAPWLMMYSVIAANIISLGAFLIILMKRARRFSFNYVFITEILIFSAWIYIQSVLPGNVISGISKLGFSAVGIQLVPFIFIPGAIAFLCVLVIEKILSFSSVFEK